MKIRSITLFYDPTIDPHARIIPRLSQFASHARDSLQMSGMEVQSLRLATTPFPLWSEARDGSALTGLAQELESDAADSGFAYLSVGPALPEYPQSYTNIPAVLAVTQNIFFSGLLTTSASQVSLSAVRACADIISSASTLSPDGFTNLRFSALANVPAGGPFFPAAYHRPGQPPACALAMECADTVLEVFHSAKTLESARNNLLGIFEAASKEISSLLEPLCVEHRVNFNGFDFSPAPYPIDQCSLGGGIESIGVNSVGYLGSISAAAFIADTLDRGRWKKTGFNGLMLPVLEDSTLARRTTQGQLTVKDLLLFSTVCGTGLDTVPLPGDVTSEQIVSLLLDIAVLSLRLDKPLTARLMPVPGKSAGDPTGFDFEYFSNGCVLGLPAEPLSGLLASDQLMDIRPRKG